MGKKSKIKTYLAGPIDAVNVKEAMKWREFVTKELKKFNITVLNPFGQKGGDRLSTVRSKFAIWKKYGNVDAIRQVVSSTVIPPDLDMVEECDFITLYIPQDDGKEICGSYGEMTLGFKLGKQVYIVTKRRLKPLNLPMWSIGCSTKIFSNWNDYFDYVYENWVNAGEQDA